MTEDQQKIMELLEKVSQDVARLQKERDAAKAEAARAVVVAKQICQELSATAHDWSCEVRDDFSSGLECGWRYASILAEEIVGEANAKPTPDWLVKAVRKVTK